MRTALLLAATVVLSACSDSASEEDVPARVTNFEVGAIVDARIQGFEYETPSVSGITDEMGEFLFRAGEDVTFEFGGYRFPAVPAQSLVTIVDLFDGGVIDRRVVNLARLLQSLDRDDFTPDVIELPPAQYLDLAAMNFDMETDDFAAMTSVRNVVALVRDEMVPAETALANMRRTFDELGIVTPPLLSEGDTDGDGIDDLVDADDDNDGVADINGGEPLPELENAPARLPPLLIAGSENGGASGLINNVSDSASAQSADSDRDDIPDAYDFFPSSRADIYYVDFGGFDQGDCSFADIACATVGYAASLASPGDLVQVLGGGSVEAGTVITTDLLTIQGLGASSEIGSGANLDNRNETAFQVAPGLRVQFAKLTMWGGDGNETGSVLDASDATVYLRQVDVRAAGLAGTAVYASNSMLSLQETVFQDSGERAIEAINSDLTVNLSAFSATNGTHILALGGTTNVNRSTFSAAAGRGIEFSGTGGTGRVDNSTFSGNAVGIAVPDDGSFSANHVTIEGAITIAGTNLSLNNSYLRGSCVDPLVPSGSGNFIEDGTCGTDPEFQFGRASNGIGTELALNGGITPTLALDADNLAVDAIACLPEVAVDQRSLPRPAGMLCDAGAFEVQ